MTEVAFHILARIESDSRFQTINEEMWRPMGVAFLLYQNFRHVRNLPEMPPEEKFRPGPMWDIEVDLCLNNVPEINGYLQQEFADKSMVQKNYGTYDPYADLTKMSDWERYCEERIILSRFLPDMTCVRKSKYSIFI